MSHPEIIKMMTLSTEHITPETSHQMEEGKSFASTSIYNKDGYGFFVYIFDSLGGFDGPSDLGDCIAFAKKHDCKMICFDNDGPVMDGLVAYDW